MQGGKVASVLNAVHSPKGASFLLFVGQTDTPTISLSSHPKSAMNVASLTLRPSPIGVSTPDLEVSEAARRVTHANNSARLLFL